MFTVQSMLINSEWQLKKEIVIIMISLFFFIPNKKRNGSVSLWQYICWTSLGQCRSYGDDVWQMTTDYDYQIIDGAMIESTI